MSSITAMRDEEDQGNGDADNDGHRLGQGGGGQRKMEKL